nr:immunoglobulin light chain junction region [Macaca mulatta]
DYYCQVWDSSIKYYIF